MKKLTVTYLGYDYDWNMEIFYIFVSYFEFIFVFCFVFCFGFVAVLHFDYSILAAVYKGVNNNFVLKIQLMYNTFRLSSFQLLVDFVCMI